MTYTNFKIAIVDNSTDNKNHEELNRELLKYSDSIEIIKDSQNSFHKITIHRIENNGFAAANNYIIKLNFNYNFIDFYWILNNDTIIPTSFLEEINTRINTTFSKTKNIIFSNTLLYPNSNIVQSIGSKINKIGIVKNCYSNEIYDKNKKYKEIFNYPNGASLFIYKETLHRIDGFSDEYFMYYEEPDLIEKGKKINLELIIFTDLFIYHKEGGSVNKLSNQRNFFQIYNLHLSRMKWVKKFYPKYIFIAKLYLILVFFKNFFTLANKDKIKLLQLIRL